MPESWLRSATERTITTPTALDAELARIRIDGAAREVGELRAEDAAIALPIHAVTGPLVGAIAVSAPIERADALPPILEQLRPFAERLSHSSPDILCQRCLGYRLILLTPMNSTGCAVTGSSALALAEVFPPA
jgi:hypothetical protein